MTQKYITTWVSLILLTNINESRLLFIMSLTGIFSICKNSYIIKTPASTSIVYETYIWIWECFLNFTSQLNIWIDVLFSGRKNPAELKP